MSEGSETSGGIGVVRRVAGELGCSDEFIDLLEVGTATMGRVIIYEGARYECAHDQITALTCQGTGHLVTVDVGDEGAVRYAVELLRGLVDGEGES